MLDETLEEESSTSEEEKFNIRGRESSTSESEDSKSEDDSITTFGMDDTVNSSTNDNIENMKKIIMNLKSTNQQLSIKNQGLNNTVVIFTSRQSLEALKQGFTMAKQNLEAENAMQVTRIQILENMVSGNNSVVNVMQATLVQLTLLQ